MDSWVVWVVISTLGFGFHAFAYRVLVAHEGDLVIAQVVFPSVVMLCAAIGLYFGEGIIAPSVPWFILIVSLQGLTFFLSNFSRIEALRRHLPAHALYPVLKLSTPIVVLLSVIVLGDQTLNDNPRTVIGIVLILSSGFLLIPWSRNPLKYSAAMVYALLAMLFSVVAVVCARYVYEEEVDVFGFVVASSFVQCVLGLINLKIGHRSISSKASLSGIGYGIVLGLLSFIAYSSFLQAVKLGDLARVATINSTYILVPIILSLVFFPQGEKGSFSFRKQVAVALSILGAVLTV